jgi:hypothetical protein
MPSLRDAQMILNNNVDPVGHEVGDEIWHSSLPEAIRCEAEKTAYHSPAMVIEHVGPEQLVELLAQDMTAALRDVGDTYIAVDGVTYTLSHPAAAIPAMTATLSGMPDQRVVVEATFEQADHGPRIAIVRWSDGTTGEAMRFYPDELLVCEGDLVGKTQEQIRSLHHRRDGDWLRS